MTWPTKPRSTTSSAPRPPGTSPGTRSATAAQQAAQIPVDAGRRGSSSPPSRTTRQPTNYTDPFWSNVGAGFSLVGGRVTALATTPDGAWFAGAADGGVWRSDDQGAHWTPVIDYLPDMSTGALAVDPVDGSLWVGTGEANESQDSYAGNGVYGRANDGATSGSEVGGTGRQPARRRARSSASPSTRRGDAYAATNNGLFRYAAAHRHSGPRFSTRPARPTSRPTTSR